MLVQFSQEPAIFASGQGVFAGFLAVFVDGLAASFVTCVCVRHLKDSLLGIPLEYLDNLASKCIICCVCWAH